jgi:hypothetical protein
MSLAFDEFGRPFIIIREQEKKKRTKGMEAHKVSIANHSCLKLALNWKLMLTFLALQKS